jgi:putative restriction endonuclease
VAFDTGVITANGGLRIHLARPLAEAIQTDPLARQYYGRPPLREVILLP